MSTREASAAVHADRLWFSHNPSARVRFRAQRPAEFHPLETLGHTVPSFLPPEFPETELLNWVAVIELSRSLGIDHQTGGAGLRIRLRTVPIRSRALQRRLAPVYEEAVVLDFLRHNPMFSSRHAA